MRHAEFRDPRLVAVYDQQCRSSREDDFFQSVVDRTPTARVVDLGCGTGRLTTALAARGHSLTGVDPAAASLAAARARPFAATVRWIEGDSSVLPVDSFQIALMTSHVAQFLVSDAAWTATLADLARSLHRGGLLLFDSRDPVARAWDRWNPVDSRHSVMVDEEVVEVWTEVEQVDGPNVTFRHHYTWQHGLTLTSTATLRFRSLDEIAAALQGANFVLEQALGGWSGEAVGQGDGELLIVARRQ